MVCSIVIETTQSVAGFHGRKAIIPLGSKSSVPHLEWTTMKVRPASVSADPFCTAEVSLLTDPAKPNVPGPNHGADIDNTGGAKRRTDRSVKVNGRTSDPLSVFKYIATIYNSDRWQQLFAEYSRQHFEISHAPIPATSTRAAPLRAHGGSRMISRTIGREERHNRG